MSHYKPYPAYKDSGVEWLGRVPEHWDVSRLRNCVEGSLSYGANEAAESDDPLNPRFIRITDLNEDGTLRKDTFKSLPPDIAHPYLLKDGDVLLARSGATVGKSFIYRRSMGAACYAGYLIRARLFESKILPRLFWYCTQSSYYWSFISGSNIQATIQNVSGEKYSNFWLAVPPITEQESIVFNLDHETARIDALIEKKTRFIELLREKRQALITHAVTKGLDPDVKMKASGVEWLGMVPEHWEVKQLKHVVDPSSSITYGIVQAGPEFAGGVPYIRTSDMSGDELPFSGYALTSPEIDESYARSRVRPGDIVMSIRASVGKCLPVPEGLSVANLTQGTAKVSPGKCITRDFLLTFLNSAAAQIYFDLMAKGATFKEITLDALRRTPVLLPPPAEQDAIDQFISRHIGRLDHLCRLSEQSILMLKERRSALITAAVTGQIDLRESA